MYSIPQRTSSDQAVFEALKNNIFTTLHCATIGVVTAFDNLTDSVTVKPVINERTINDKGKIQWVDFPEIADTPYISFSTTQPNPGDPCVLIFTDYDFSAWWNSGATNYDGTPKTVNQEVIRRHNISNAVAIMGLHTKGVYNGSTQSSGTEVSGSGDNNGTGVSEKLIAFIESWEGFVGTAYRGEDYWNQTIGYGHVIQPGENYTTITQEQADALLRSDLTTYINSVKNQFSAVTLKQNQFDALVSLCYNLGAYIWSSINLTAAVKSNEPAATITQYFQALCHVGTTTSAGLLARRTAEANMYNNGVYISND